MEKHYYSFIVYHEKLGPQFGCKWTTNKPETYEEANKSADKICERLQHGKKPNKRQGPLVHTIPTINDPF